MGGSRVRGEWVDSERPPPSWAERGRFHLAPWARRFHLGQAGRSRFAAPFVRRTIDRGPPSQAGPTPPLETARSRSQPRQAQRFPLAAAPDAPLSRRGGAAAGGELADLLGDDPVQQGPTLPSPPRGEAREGRPS